MSNLKQITLRLDAMQRSLEEVREDVDQLKRQDDFCTMCGTPKGYPVDDDLECPAHEGNFADDYEFASYERLWTELEGRLDMPSGVIAMDGGWILTQDESGTICAEHVDENVPLVYCTPGYEAMEGIAIRVVAAHNNTKMAWYTVALSELSVQAYKLIVQEILNSVTIAYSDGIASFHS